MYCVQFVGGLWACQRNPPVVFRMASVVGTERLQASIVHTGDSSEFRQGLVVQSWACNTPAVCIVWCGRLAASACNLATWHWREGNASTGQRMCAGGGVSEVQRINKRMIDTRCGWALLATACALVLYQPATPNHHRPTLSYTSAIMGVTSLPNNGKQ